ncbi:hypothetical protein AHAS_Ahas20G0279900 [Arachis hypogaea]
MLRKEKIKRKRFTTSIELKRSTKSRENHGAEEDLGGTEAAYTTIEILVRDNLERQSILNFVSVNSSKGVIMVAGDALINSEQEEMEVSTKKEEEGSWRGRGSRK